MTNKMQIRQNDTAPPVTATLSTIDGAPINLTGASVVFVMRHSQSRVLKVDHQPATLVDAVNGKVSYAWQAGDTSAVDTYDAGWVITFADGTQRSVPSGPPAAAVIVNPAI